MEKLEHRQQFLPYTHPRGHDALIQVAGPLLKKHVDNKFNVQTQGVKFVGKQALDQHPYPIEFV
jgi:hypothetical protein